MPRKSRCGDYLRPNGWVPSERDLSEMTDMLFLQRDPDLGTITFEEEERLLRAASRTTSVKPYVTSPLLRATVANYRELAEAEEPTAKDRLERLEATIAPERARLADAYADDPEIDLSMAEDMASAQLNVEMMEFFTALATRELRIEDFRQQGVSE